MDSLRPYQAETLRVLTSGCSALVVAPTGFGKTRAALIPFVAGFEAVRSHGRAPLAPGGTLGSATGSTDAEVGGDPKDTRAELARLGTRLIYSLPLRALAAGVYREIQRLTGRVPTIHHGQQPDSTLFAEHVVITTIDQYLTAFAGAPLSFAAAHGHAAAGAALASYTVFDEVHLLDPRGGLPLLAAVLMQRARWRLPTAVMTATLPSSVRSRLVEWGELTLVAPTDAEVHEARDRWRHVELEHIGPRTAEAALEEVIRLQREHGRVLWFVNSVERAVSAYRALRERGVAALLAHSRFRHQDRLRIETELAERLGPDSAWEGVVVTTQVSEAGLNVTSPAVLTEAAPADALVQRAGRCARFPAPGTVTPGTLWVYEPAVDTPHAPYGEHEYASTVEILRQRRRWTLTWAAEQAFVDEALDAIYTEYLLDRAPGRGTRSGARPLTPADAFGRLERAFRERNPDPVEEKLRDLLQVHVIVQRDPAALARRLEAEFRGRDRTRRRLPETIVAPVGLLRDVWRRGTLRHPLHAVVRPRTGQVPELREVSSSADIRPGLTYVLHPEDAGYSPALGLTLQPGLGGHETGWLERPVAETDDRPRRWQLFVEHATGVTDRAEAIFRRYKPFFAGWLELFAPAGAGADDAGRPDAPSAREWLAQRLVELQRLVVAAALVHDVGKLAVAWQEAARAVATGTEDPAPPEPLARTPHRGRVPPHAHAAYFALRGLLGTGGPAGELVALATARHHDIGREDVVRPRPWSPVPEGVSLLARLLAQRLGLDEAQVARTLADPGLPEGLRPLAVDAASPSDDLYPLYVWVHRIVKVADWEDAAGEVVELPWLRSA